MKDELRLLIAFLLSILVIVSFGKYQQKKKSDMKQIFSSSPEVVEKIEQVGKEEKEEKKEEVGKSSFLPSSYSGKYITDENELFTVKWDVLGGKIKEIGLKKYKRLDENHFYILNDSFSLLEYPEENKNWANTVYSGSKKYSKVVFEGSPDEKLKVVKSYEIFPASYTIKYTVEIENNGNEISTLKNYMVLGGNVDFGKTQRGMIPPEVLVETNGVIVTKSAVKISEKVIYDNSPWICFKARYRLLFLRTEKSAKAFLSGDQNGITFGMMYPEIVIEPGKSKELTFSFYAGPSDYFIAYNEIQEDIFGKGAFVSMGRIIFGALLYIHKVVPNWGWAIIFLTIIIKLVFYPLTKNSLRSMKKMQELRPYLKDVQTKYKNNPQQMQKELMALYKSYKINPFGGCIPMLIQFPIFIGFFIALKNSIFLRGAPFMFWIKDLSMPDTLLKINEFPINLLPVIMAATSFLQQKLTPQEPSQKGLMVMMPFMFLFLFYNFSSGLLLYWVTMNLGSLVEQYFIHKK